MFPYVNTRGDTKENEMYSKLAAQECAYLVPFPRPLVPIYNTAPDQTVTSN
jgi:hypothetical protein